MEIATKEIIFDLLPTIDLRYQIASQCLSHNFPRSISKRIKTQVETNAMAPRFKIDTSMHMYKFQDLFHITRRKEKKTSENEGLDGKSGKNTYCFFIALYYNNLVISSQRLIAACANQILMFLINMPGIYFFRTCYKKINT